MSKTKTKTKSRPQVSNQALREKYIELEDAGRVTPSSVAVSADLIDASNRPDVSRVKRLLGLQRSSDQRWTEEIDHELAKALAYGMGLDPVDFDF